MTMLALSGCGTGGTLAPRFVGPQPPKGVATRSAPVSGLVVGHRLMEAQQYELALKAYLRAAGTLGATPQVLASLGSANLRLGRLGQAERLLRQAVRRDPALVPAWNNLGVVLMESGQAPEAMEVFRRAYALDSGGSDAIRENLKLAIARTENTQYGRDTDKEFDLVLNANGTYRLMTAPQITEQ